MTETTPEEIVEELKKQNRLAVDAAYAQGMADATPPERYEFSNGRTRRISDPGYDVFEAEVKALMRELRAEGVRNSQARNHPSMVALRARHNR
jgi:hypothetical protein